MSIEEMIEKLADGIGVIGDILRYRSKDLIEDDYYDLNDVILYADWIKEKLEKRKGGER